MSEALKILNNIRTLRAQARECTLETLEEMLEKLEVVVNERREEESAAAAEVEERTRKLQQYREMLIADGIDPNELLNSLAAVKSGTKAKRAQRPAPEWCIFRVLPYKSCITFLPHLEKSRSCKTGTIFSYM